jgi:hypothetical protein
VFFVMGKGNDRLRGTRVRLVPGLVMSISTLAVAACGAAVVPASVAGQPSGTAATTTAASTHARAEAELGRLLASVRVPSGATAVTSAPVAYLAQPPVSEAAPNLLTRTSWWRIDMPFADTLTWMQGHPPGGLQSGSGGQAGGPGVPLNRFLGFSVPSTTAYDGAAVNVELVAISSTETGMRADAELIWLPPKPSEEFVPAGTAVTLVAYSHFGSSDATVLRTKHLDSADAVVMINDINALLPSDGGSRGCAADFGYRVQVEVAVAGTPLVFSDWSACALVPVTRDSTKLLTLSPSPAFENEITHLMGPPPTP